MVYLGNIIKEHMEMKADEVICFMFKSGMKIYVNKQCTLEKSHGDLKIISVHGLRVYVDCAEVEQIIVGKEAVLKKGD